jgi:uncharacterized membrane protein YdjX (TVP38/TMEM64 family)
LSGTVRLLAALSLTPVVGVNLVNNAAALTEISWWTFLWGRALLLGAVATT